MQTCHKAFFGHVFLAKNLEMFQNFAFVFRRVSVACVNYEKILKVLAGLFVYQFGSLLYAQVVYFVVRAVLHYNIFAIVAFNENVFHIRYFVPNARQIRGEYCLTGHFGTKTKTNRATRRVVHNIKSQKLECW